MSFSSSPGADSGSSPSRLPTSAPSSPPSAYAADGDCGIMDSVDPEEAKQLLAEEEKARLENAAAERKRKVALKRRSKKAMSKTEREAKARDLDVLLDQSAMFSDSLNKKTEVLGRVGTALDGKRLGGGEQQQQQHEFEMKTQPKCMVGGTMRDYQLEGLTWMYEVCLQGLSGILADEMGLGKTLQTIALIALLREQENYLGPHLIIAPLSTLSNWLDEFHKWTPSIPVVMYHGTPAQRKSIATNKILRHISNGKPTARFPVVCTSYEMVLRDRAVLSKINWEFIIVDEGHRMKNFDSKLFRELQQFKSATRLLITGTPLQNNLKELWSLLHFLLPSIFTDWEVFETWFDFSALEDEDNVEDLISDQVMQDLVKKMHSVLQPFLLRRVKADVAKYLPKKREYVLYAPMTKEQTDLYNAITNKNIDTREYLENKVVECLTSAANSQASSRKASRVPSSRSSVSRNTKAETRTEKAAKKSRNPVPAMQNAFSLMMGKGRGRPPKSPAAAAPSSDSEPLPAKQGVKRKGQPALESPISKSSKSSRQSTPADSARGRQRAGRKTRYKEADSSEEELDDDAFEAKLAQEFTSEGTEDETGNELSAEEFERAKTLEIAKKEMSRKKLGNPLLQLRLVCNSPHNFYNPWAIDEGLPVDESIVTASGKMLLLDRLLPALFKKDHKVLLFSQFKTQLNILEDYCALRRWEFCRLDGEVSQENRRQQIAEFNTNPDVKLFLLSTRAGGQGINLASADTVILFDSDWNPQQDLQAQDRCHRIGQTRPVIVYRLATKDTVEEELLLSADAKRRLEKLVIKKGRFRTMGQKMDVSEVLDRDSLKSILLKDGQAYEFSGDKEILGDKDLEVLCDRSDEAYARAAIGEGNALGYQVVETGASGITATVKTS